MLRSFPSGVKGDLVISVRMVLGTSAVLGEGPLWDARQNLLYWVDILGGALHRWDPRAERDATVLLGQPIGAVALNENGGLLAALKDGFGLLDPETGAVRWSTPVGTGRDRRMNDGKVDPAGRFLAGTMAMDGSPGRGALYRLDPTGHVACVLDHVSVSNGLDWSLDGQVMYFVDSGNQGVDSFHYDLSTGALSNRRRLVDVPADAGVPDGLTVDAEGGIWLALHGGGALQRYGRDGTLDEVVSVPVPQVTSCAFGGEDLGDLYITTAMGGGLYRCRPGVSGRLPNRARLEVADVP
jgi:sugar lactone lactonase YvrE